MTTYIGIAVYLVNLVGWKLIFRTRRRRASEVDLVTDRRMFEEVEEEEEVAHKSSTKVWAKKLSFVKR